MKRHGLECHKIIKGTTNTDKVLVAYEHIVMIQGTTLHCTDGNYYIFDGNKDKLLKTINLIRKREN